MNKSKTLKKTDDLAEKVIWHRQYNIDKKHNLDEIPEEKSIFAIFALIRGKQSNCRYVGQTDNLNKTIVSLFEGVEECSVGLKTFMQGPWIKMVVYKTMKNITDKKRDFELNDWIKKYDPKVDDDGEYPGYYNY